MELIGSFPEFALEGEDFAEVNVRGWIFRIQSGCPCVVGGGFVQTILSGQDLAQETMRDHPFGLEGGGELELRNGLVILLKGGEGSGQIAVQIGTQRVHPDSLAGNA